MFVSKLGVYFMHIVNNTLFR